MAMIPTYVTGVPTGKEIGCVYARLFALRDCKWLKRSILVTCRTFLALDLGGTNLYVMNLLGGSAMTRVPDSHLRPTDVFAKSSLTVPMA